MAESNPSGRELEILKILWDLGPASVRQVYEQMCPGGELAFNTVQTLLRIMDDKGLVRHRRQGRKLVYTPCHSREREAARVLDRLFDGALDRLVLSLISARDTSPAELRELEKLLADARKQKQGEAEGK